MKFRETLSDNTIMAEELLIGLTKFEKMEERINWRKWHCVGVTLREPADFACPENSRRGQLNSMC